MSRKMKSYPIWMQISVCLFGCVLFLSSYVPVVLDAGVWPEVLRQLGIGVLVFGLTSFALTHWYSKLASDQINLISNEIKEITVNTFDLVKSAKDSGISKIYPLRTGELESNPGAEKSFHEKIKREFNIAAKKALESKGDVQKIKMIGVSLRAFLNDAVDLYPTMENALNNDRLKFEILLLDPFSAQSVFRSERESQKAKDTEYENIEEHFSSTLFQDLQKCTKTLIRFIGGESAAQDGRVEARLYSTAPSCMLIFINDHHGLE